MSANGVCPSPLFSLSLSLPPITPDVCWKKTKMDDGSLHDKRSLSVCLHLNRLEDARHQAAVTEGHWETHDTEVFEIKPACQLLISLFSVSICDATLSH